MSSPGNTAVLLLGFGGPERFEDVRPFIENVVRGRNVPPSRIDAVVEQYREIGGKSPFNELTRAQAKALQEELANRGISTPVHVGMLYWAPYISDILNELIESGTGQVVAVIMAVHRTEASYDRYIRALDAAIEEAAKRTGKCIKVSYVEQWHQHPLFIEAAAERVLSAMATLKNDELDLARIIFTAHSIPQQMSDESGYDRQVKETAAAIASRVRGLSERNIPWEVAYQSRSGPPNQPWLEPDIQHQLALSVKQGKKFVIVAPIGFVSDHVEVLYDLDILAANTASELGMQMYRVPTVGDHPKFIRLLGELTAAHAELFYARSDKQ